MRYVILLFFSCWFWSDGFGQDGVEWVVEPSLEFDARSTKTFFVNNLDFGGGGGIVAVSCIVKQIKAYSRSGRTEFRLRFCQIQVSTMYVV